MSPDLPPKPRRSESIDVTSWRHRLDGILAALAPPRCAGCSSVLTAHASEIGVRTRPGGNEPGPSSRGADDRRLSSLFCRACETALDLEPATHDLEAIGRSPWPVHATLRYAGTGEAWLRRIKYPQPGIAGLDADARGLLFALARDAATRLPLPDAIVPVPLHRSAYLHREFNPALLFAHALARATGARVRPGLLSKRRVTQPQKGLGLGERRANVAGAYGVPERQRAALRGEPLVFVVDDVMTTGATLEACIGALRAGGLTRAGIAVCLARTPRHQSHAIGRNDRAKLD